MKEPKHRCGNARRSALSPNVAHNAELERPLDQRQQGQPREEVNQEVGGVERTNPQPG